MSLPSLNPQQAAFVERIVREVIRRLNALQGARGVNGDRGVNRASEQSQPSLTAQPTPQRSNPFAAATTAQATTAEKLITAATLSQLPQGTRELLVPQRAVITPLAKDEARDRRIQIIRGTADQTASGAVIR